MRAMEECFHQNFCFSANGIAYICGQQYVAGTWATDSENKLGILKTSRSLEIVAESIVEEAQRHY